MIYGIFFIFAGYLSGSSLFAYLIPKYFYHIDIEEFIRTKAAAYTMVAIVRL